MPDPGQADRDLDGTGDACDPDDAPALSATASGPANVHLGQTVSVTGLVDNAGLLPAPASQVRLYLSDDASFDPASDPLVGDCHTSVIAPAGQDGCTDTGAVVPADLFVLAPGETAPYHWVACADGFDVVSEADETDNCTVSPQVVTVPEPAVVVQGIAGLAAILGLGRRARARRIALPQRRA